MSTGFKTAPPGPSPPARRYPGTTSSFRRRWYRPGLRNWTLAQYSGRSGAVRLSCLAGGQLARRSVTYPAHTSKGGTFLVRCILTRSFMVRRWQGEEDRLCIPAGGGLCAQVLARVTSRPSPGSGDILGEPDAAPRLLGAVGGSRHCPVRALMPDLPAHQCGARWPKLALAPHSLAVAARRNDRGGLDRRLGDDGGQFRHEPEPCRNAVRQGGRPPYTLNATVHRTVMDTEVIIRDMRRVPRLGRARGRGQVDSDAAPPSRACARASTPRLMTSRTSTPRWSGPGLWRHQRHAAWPQ